MDTLISSPELALVGAASTGLFPISPSASYSFSHSDIHVVHVCGYSFLTLPGGEVRLICREHLLQSSDSDLSAVSWAHVGNFPAEVQEILEDYFIRVRPWDVPLKKRTDLRFKVALRNINRYISQRTAEEIREFRQSHRRPSLYAFVHLSGGDGSGGFINGEWSR